jgi:hypothetical protein
MVRTLNGSYHTQPYGLGNADTRYPISAFVTHLVYLRGSNVPVDVEHITVRGFVFKFARLLCCERES